MTGTAVALTAGGLVGLAWMADWLPIEFGDAPSGEVSEFNIDDIDFSSFEPGQPDPGLETESPWSSNEPPEDIFAGQSEPSFSDNARSDSREFVSRADLTSSTGNPGDSPRAAEPSGIRTASATSIPEEFPSFEELRPRGTARSAVGRDGRVNLETEPHQVVDGSPFETEAASTRDAPRFDSTAGSLNQAREFPDSVAVLDRSRTTSFDDPNGNSPETGTTAAPVETTPVTGSPRTATNGTEPATTAREAQPAVGTELDLQKIDAWLKEGDYVSAHRDLSKVYWNHPESRRYIQERLNRNAKLIYFSPQPHFLDPHIIQSGDYLQKIAPKYGISWQYLANLNAINPRRIRAGQKLKVIKGPFSVFVDLSDFELTVHCHGFYVKRYGIGIGKDGASPQGKFTVLNKVEKPQWTDPNGRVVAGDDPTNPLGTHWIDIGDGFGIHGTTDPRSIGKAESRGCIRMQNSDVKEVYDFLLNGSEVVIRP